MPTLISLTTDFGLSDSYVGMMKGSIYDVNPAAVVIDLTHSIEPQNVRQGAFLLFNAYRTFPANTIHIAVVDPGVGTERKPVCLVVPERGIFIGPDNGLFSLVIEAELQQGKILTAYHTCNTVYHRSEISHTFHGRDIFAPLAAHLSTGVSPHNTGPLLELDALVKLDKMWPEVSVRDNKKIIRGRVAHIDHFGNVISNIPAGLLGEMSREQRESIRLNCSGVKVRGLKETYGQVKEGRLLLLSSSSGFIELARSNGRADTSGESGLKIKIGDKFKLSFWV